MARSKGVVPGKERTGEGAGVSSGANRTMYAAPYESDGADGRSREYPSAIRTGILRFRNLWARV